jgi:hypothetical protein
MSLAYRPALGHMDFSREHVDMCQFYESVRLLVLDELTRITSSSTDLFSVDKCTAHRRTIEDKSRT